MTETSIARAIVPHVTTRRSGIQASWRIRRVSAGGRISLAARCKGVRAAAGPGERLLYNGRVGLFAAVLLVLAVVLVLAAEWPRITERLGLDEREPRTPRRRRRRRGAPELTLIEGSADDDEFAASVERDLANLPVIEERDDRQRR